MIFHFPQYRKLNNDLSYYCIPSADELIEVQRLGGRWTEHSLRATILPERNLIMDILDYPGGPYIVINQEEFEVFRSFCSINLKRF